MNEVLSPPLLLTVVVVLLLLLLLLFDGGQLSEIRPPTVFMAMDHNEEGVAVVVAVDIILFPS